MKHDGSVTFNTKIDNSGVEKDLKETERKIEKSTKDLQKAESEKLPLLKQIEDIEPALEGAKIKLADLQKQQSEAVAALSGTDIGAYSDAFFVKSDLDAAVVKQQREVDKLQKKWDSVNDKIDKYDIKIKQAKADIKTNTAAAGQLKSQLSSGGAKIAAAVDKVHNSAKRLEKRLISLASRAFIFTMISAGLREIREYMGKAFKTTEQYTAQLAKLKGALLTAFQPVYEFILPGVIAVLKVLTAIVQVVANVLSRLSGKTAKESAESAKELNKEAEALDSVSSAAKEAQRNLAGFDEINKLSDSDVSGGSSESTSTPDFSDFNTDEYKREIDELTVYLSGALLAIGAILTFSGANIPLGIALMAAGAAGLVTTMKVNWNSMDNDLRSALTKILVILGGAFLVIGAILAFSGVSVAKGIALMAIGAASLVGAVALNWNTISKALQGPIGDAAAYVSSALLVLGCVLAFTGAAIPLGIALMAAGAAGLVTVAAVNWDTIVSSVEGPVSAIFAIAGAALLVLGIILVCSGVGIPLGIALILAGAAGLITVAVVNWDFMKDKISSMWGGVVQWFNTKVKPVLTVEYWKNKFSCIGDGLKQKIKDGVNAAISLFNKFISWVNEKLNISWKGFSIGGTKIIDAGNFQLLKIPEIPCLAQGAVLPANKPFLSVVGDQKHGTNVEAPLTTIQEAVAIVMEDMVGSQTAGFEAVIVVLQQILEAVLGIEIDGETLTHAVESYQRKMAVARGG